MIEQLPLKTIELVGLLVTCKLFETDDERCI